MSRIFQRAAAVVAGMAMPLAAWALVAPSTVGDQYVEITQDLPVADEVAIAGVELLNASEFDIVRADAPDRSSDPAVPADNVAARCCVWIYSGGMWYCFPCT